MTRDVEMQQLWRNWQAACAREDVARALHAAEDAVEQAIAERGPTCWSSGKCCHFESYGHRLYVTGLEVAWFLSRVGAGGPKPAAPGDASQGDEAPGDRTPEGLALPVLDPAELPRANGCPYQQGKLCGVHAIRPVGCRVFFCEEGQEDWQHGVYEQHQQRIRALHDEHLVPYEYMEWRYGLGAALEALG